MYNSEIGVVSDSVCDCFASSGRYESDYSSINDQRREFLCFRVSASSFLFCFVRSSWIEMPVSFNLRLCERIVFLVWYETNFTIMGRGLLTPGALSPFPFSSPFFELVRSLCGCPTRWARSIADLGRVTPNFSFAISQNGLLHRVFSFLFRNAKQANTVPPQILFQIVVIVLEGLYWWTLLFKLSSQARYLLYYLL